MITGTGDPKFVYDQGGEDEEIVFLDEVAILKNEPIRIDLEAEDKLSGQKDIFNIGERWIFEVRHNLYLHQPISNFNKLWRFQNKKVILYPHREGYAFQNKEGKEVLFFLKIRRIWLETIDEKDLLIMTFESTEPVDYGKLVLPENVLTDNNGMIITDSDGNFITG